MSGSARSNTFTSRRRFMAMAGGGVLFAAAGATGFALTRTPASALRPWQLAGNYQEPRRFALSYAILAPNPHNLQPWLLDLRKPGQVTLLPDPARRLPETDPFDRQLTIGLGCFLELLAIAASQTGHRLDIHLFPEGQDDSLLGGRPVADIRFERSEEAGDPLFQYVLQRRSTKAPYDMQRSVADEQLSELAPTVPGVRFAGSVDTSEVAELRSLIWRAWQVEFNTAATHRENVELMRIGKRQINASPDGVSVGGPALVAMQAVGLLSHRTLERPGSIAHNTGYRMYHQMLQATPAFVWLSTPGNTRQSQIAAGRAWLRMNLACTQLGLALHPVSQCLQEYAEMREHYDLAHQMMARAGETVQMLGRLGYADEAPPTPRWTLDEKIISS